MKKESNGKARPANRRSKSGRAIPPQVVKRLTKYLTHVRELRREGVPWVSSAGLAATLGLTPSTVRQDLSYVDSAGSSRRGYPTEGLSLVLLRALGAEETWRCIVAGAGNLGKALFQHHEFERQGYLLQGIFDNDNRKVGTRIGDMAVQGMKDLKRFVAAHGIQIGILAVPADAAQEVANTLMAAGISGLLNLTCAHVQAAPNVAVVDARIVASLLELSYAVKAKTRPS